MIGCAVALVLLLDASLSVNAQDFQRQVEGTAAAFEDQAITRLIEGHQGGIAVSAMTFEATTELAVPWVHLRTAAEAQAFASRIRRIEHRFGSDTQIGPAINSAVEYMAAAPCEADEQVIDISTDGKVYPAPVARARDAAQEQGVRINAIGVGDLTDLYDFLFEHVRTYNGFVMAVQTWDQFTSAIRRKLALEIASTRTGSFDPT